MPFREVWLLAGPVLIGVGAGTGQPMVTGIGVVILIVGAMSRLWARYLFRRVRVRSSLSETRAFQGESVDLRFELENRKLLPLPWFDLRLAISEELEVEGEAPVSASAPGVSWLTRRGALGWYERRRWRVRLSARERGHFQIGPSQIQSADLLGIFSRHWEGGETTSFLAYPRVFALDDLGFPADRPWASRRAAMSSSKTRSASPGSGTTSPATRSAASTGRPPPAAGSFSRVSTSPRPSSTSTCFSTSIRLSTPGRAT